jgi:hypothetical protein
MTFGGNHHVDDTGLHDDAGAIQAGHDVHVDGAAFGGGAGAGGVADEAAASLAPGGGYWRRSRRPTLR